MLTWAQSIADRAYGVQRLHHHGFETDAVEICAARGRIKPHRDDHEGVDGMRIHGLVLRSDHHRLHSERLHAAGVTDGLPLAAGDLYVMDPFDLHWTECPDHPDGSQLIFSVNIMSPDGRRPATLAHDMWWSVLAASIDAGRGR